MPDRPLGIQDIVDLNHPDAVSAPEGWDECWYWCRRHERAEHVSEPDPVQIRTSYLSATHAPCVRVGPFMSEREANRLAVWGGPNLTALGMEVER